MEKLRPRCKICGHPITQREKEGSLQWMHPRSDGYGVRTTKDCKYSFCDCNNPQHIEEKTEEE